MVFGIAGIENGSRLYKANSINSELVPLKRSSLHQSSKMNEVSLQMRMHSKKKTVHFVCATLSIKINHPNVHMPCFNPLHSASYYQVALPKDSCYKIFFGPKLSELIEQFKLQTVRNCSWWKETDYWPQAMLQKSCESPVWCRIRYGATRALESKTTSRVPTRRPEGRRSERKTILHSSKSHQAFISNCWLKSYIKKTKCYTVWKVHSPTQ